MKKVVTIIKCSWCPHSSQVPCRKTLFGNYKESKYPKDWRDIEGDVICPSCVKKYLKMVGDCKRQIQDEANKANKKKKVQKAA